MSFRLWDPAEQERLLAMRARTVAAQWRRVRRAAVRFLSPAERELLAVLPAETTWAPLVALATELEEYGELADRWQDHEGGDGEALADLIDFFIDSEHVQALMPSGRMPKRPAPSVRRILDGIRDDLLARVVLQGVLGADRAPRGAGRVTLRPRPAASWGSTTHSLTVGGARAVYLSDRPLPTRYTFRWADGACELAGGGLRLRREGAGAPLVSTQPPGVALELLPSVAGWSLLPPVLDEDGPATRATSAGHPRPGRRGFAKSLLARAPEQSDRIERALAVLGAAWPEGRATVGRFTAAIIPVTQPQVVSYSFYPVCGWSYLNLYARDFVDLVDDLVHENAHHHLNHILADAKLLVSDEPEPNPIYWSPWRRALRPLRGILHSVFTFAAGAELFRQLHRALAQGRIALSAAEGRKIAARCLEETVQVRYSLDDLEHAGRAGRLTARGRALVAELAVENRGFATLAPPLRAAVAGTAEGRRLAAIEAELAERRAMTDRFVRRVG